MPSLRFQPLPTNAPPEVVELQRRLTRARVGLFFCERGKDERKIAKRRADISKIVTDLHECEARHGIVKVQDLTFIYFLQVGEYVKIGQSRSWRKRMNQMQVGSPHPIVPLLVLVSYPILEKHLHQQFIRDHFRGEWFFLSDAIRCFVAANSKQCVIKGGDKLRPVDNWMDLR